MRTILLSILLCWVGLSFAKSPVAVYDNSHYISCIYNLDEHGFHSIDSLSLPVGYKKMFDAYHLFWQSINDDDDVKMNEAEMLLDGLSLTKIQDPLLKVSVALLKMRIALINKNYLSAVQPQMIIKRYFESQELRNEPYDVFLRGMYHYFVSYGRTKSLFYKALLVGWSESNSAEGIKRLEKMANYNSILISTEAHYFLGRIYLEYEDNPQKAQVHFKHLVQCYPQNKVYADFYANCLRAL